MTIEPPPEIEQAEPELVHWYPPRRRLPYPSGAQAMGAASLGAGALATLAVGALAIGALAIGALAIGRLAVGRARFKALHIDRLTVGSFKLLEK